MFHWDKSLQSLPAPAAKVIQLFRSMRDVQLALPGLPPQESSAYLCQYATLLGVGTVAVFHLHKSGQLAFYRDEPQEVAADQAAAMLERGQVFVESMGFLLTDLDIQLLDSRDREKLWASLPLHQGIAAAASGGTPRKAASKALPPLPPLAPGPVPPTADEHAMPVARPPVDRSSPAVRSRPTSADESADVDQLLAAVAQLRTRRSAAAQTCRPPDPREQQRRRQELREQLGRILASL